MTNWNPYGICISGDTTASNGTVQIERLMFKVNGKMWVTDGNILPEGKRRKLEEDLLAWYTSRG